MFTLNGILTYTCRRRLWGGEKRNF